MRTETDGGESVGGFVGLEGLKDQGSEFTDIALHVVDAPVHVVEAGIDVGVQVIDPPVQAAVDAGDLRREQAAQHETGPDDGPDDGLRIVGHLRSVAPFRAAAACLVVLTAAPATAQGIRTVTASDVPIPVLTQVRHTTTVVVPPPETIVDVVAGDAEYWDVSAAAHVAYIKPLDVEAASNVTLVAESGRVWALLVVESSTDDPDLVVHIEDAEQRTPEQAERQAPRVVPGVELTVYRGQVAAAEAERQAIDAAAAEEVSSIWAEHDAAWSRWLADYPRRLRFPYQLDPEASRAPFLVDALWHDGRFTYLRSRAQETPALYELQEADRRFGRTGVDPSLVAYEVFDDGLYVADHVLGAGRLQIGDSQTEWTLERNPGKWPWRARAVVGGMLGAVVVVLLHGMTR